MSEEVEALRAEVALLREELRALKATRGMKREHRCPACDGRKLLHVRRMQQMSGTPLSLSMQYHGRLKTLPAPVGKLAAFVCVACGYLELYANSSKVDIDGKHIMFVEGEEPRRGPPYR